MVRYKTLPEHAAENARLVHAVFDALRASAPAPKIQYATYTLPDGVTFVHLATVEDVQHNPLTTLPAFAEFQKDMKARCAEPPVLTELTAVDAYALG